MRTRWKNKNTIGCCFCTLALGLASQKRVCSWRQRVTQAGHDELALVNETTWYQTSKKPLPLSRLGLFCPGLNVLYDTFPTRQNSFWMKYNPLTDWQAQNLKHVWWDPNLCWWMANGRPAEGVLGDCHSDWRGTWLQVILCVGCLTV